MFAKLKKKIQEEGGAVSDSDRSLTPIPGHASPLRRNSGTPLASPASKDRSGHDSDSGLSSIHSPSSQASEDTVTRENGSLLQSKESSNSKDELLSMLEKRTEQCRKFESKISEYAAIIKDRNKSVDKLEKSLENQQDDAAKKIQHQNEQYQADRIRLSDRAKEAFESKEEEWRDHVAKLEKDKEELEEYKNNYSKTAEESNELQHVTSQELVNVKQTLLSVQQELAKQKEDIQDKDQNLKIVDKKAKDLENEVTQLKNKLRETEKECERLQEAGSGHAALVNTLSADNVALKDSNSKLSKEIKETNKLLEEKDDHIEQLQEHVKTLEQRLQDHSLTGDERVTALESERDGFEAKLSETRHQLAEIKSSWSDKITHLEEQIAHLNAKIVEDSEELASTQKYATTTRENLHKEIEMLRQKLADSEKQSEENWDVAVNKAVLHDKEKQSMEMELSKCRMEKVDMETQLRSKIDSLESQMRSLETAKEHEKSLLEQQISHLEDRQQDFMAKELRMEKRVEELEKDHNKLQGDWTEKCDECSLLRQTLEEKGSSEKELSEKVASLQKEVVVATEKAESCQRSSKSMSSDLQSCTTEKDELMIRNAELSQQMAAHQRKHQEEKRELDMELNVKLEEITTLMHSLDHLRDKMQQHESRVEEMERQNNQAQVESTYLQNLQKTVTSLEQELAEKNKMLKKQEQRLTDLKKTLQRELRVQTLPNDDTMETRPVMSTPPLQRKALNSRLSPQPDIPPNSYRSLSPTNALNHHRISEPPHMNNGQMEHKMENDTNFQYLRHVVLKFMLSRETEAVHLIRAVSVLLKFTGEEQRLIKETLEYKSSWFGTKPASGTGQTSKVIPPSY